MAPGIDPAILEALKLDEGAKLSPHGGSGFSSTFKLSGTKNGQPVVYFVKTGSGPESEVMFRGEHASLNAIHAAVPTFCPRSHAHGPLQATRGSFFLATDFLELGASSRNSSSSSSRSGSGLSLAAKLAQLHTTPAPTPDGHAEPAFGFPVPTCCGATPQENGWRASWADFYADNRLRAILRQCVRANGGGDGALEDAVERVATVVVPRLLGDGHLKAGGGAGGKVVPVVVHGDLWSGNHGRGRLVGGDGGVEEVVYDPSCVYGHSEYELGIMRMFGGFGGAFWKEYHSLVPKSEPEEEWEDRVALYELYHYLNHYALFGGGYRGSAKSIMAKLISKYG